MNAISMSMIDIFELKESDPLCFMPNAAAQ
jgi:hypothetical protein